MRGNRRCFCFRTNQGQASLRSPILRKNGPKESTIPSGPPLVKCMCIKCHSSIVKRHFSCSRKIRLRRARTRPEILAARSTAGRRLPGITISSHFTPNTGINLLKFRKKIQNSDNDSARHCFGVISSSSNSTVTLSPFRWVIYWGNSSARPFA